MSPVHMIEVHESADCLRVSCRITNLFIFHCWLGTCGFTRARAYELAGEAIANFMRKRAE